LLLDLGSARHLTGSDLLEALTQAVGRHHVLTGAARVERFASGYRYGGGEVLAVVRPGSLLELWRVTQACTRARAVVIAQAANTGLTGGSTPDAGNYGRPVVIISTLRIDGITPIASGTQVVCRAGATLAELESRLKPLGREPHSVIGSTCLGASVVGGVCNSSGGALVHRGPSFTRFSLFAKLNEEGELSLVNHLAIDLPDEPETALSLLDCGPIEEERVRQVPTCGHAESYASHVRDTTALTPARYNADPRGLHEASGSAGKVIVFAVRLDTFPAPKRKATFYVGTNDDCELAEIRTAVLKRYHHLPVSAEYIHRDAYRIAARYGKDVFLAIRYVGTKRLGMLDTCKRQIDRLVPDFMQRRTNASDRLLQFASSIMPNHLPRRMNDFHRRFEHHLILTAADDGIEEARAHLSSVFPSASGDMFACNPTEAESAARHRFAVAAAAVRFRAIHHARVEEIVALDVALPRNTRDWVESAAQWGGEVVEALYYGHFLCYVFHRDYLLAKGADAGDFEQRLLNHAAAAGSKCPAEHNVGHIYHAEPALLAHYRALDPTNAFNPGIGKSSKAPNWALRT
jgi:D-lactate dehydrogenase